MPWQFPLQRIPQLDDPSKVPSLLQHLQLVCLSKRDSAPESGHERICCAAARVVASQITLVQNWRISETFGTLNVQFWSVSPWGQRFMCGSAFALIIDWTHSNWPVLRMQTSSYKHSACEEKGWNETAMIMPVKSCQSDFLSRSVLSSRLTSKHQRRHDLILVNLKMFSELIASKYWPRLAPILLWRNFTNIQGEWQYRKIACSISANLLSKSKVLTTSWDVSSWTFMNIESNMTWCCFRRFRTILEAEACDRFALEVNVPWLEKKIVVKLKDVNSK